MSTLLLIDGNNLFHRAYHALPPLTDKSGENANAVYGFSNMLLKAIDEVKPTYIACAFDTKAPTFRHIEFEKYKAQRPAPPADLYPQLPKVKRVLEAFGIPYFEKEGYEADDLLATIATRAIFAGPATPKNSISVVILSGDRDVLQLVNGDIKVQMPGWNLNGTTLYGAAEVREKFGIEPVQMVDYKSLVGDTSDNVPGIAGIGPKIASSLLSKYQTLENLFEHIDEQGETVKAKLTAGRDIALSAKRLVELDCNVNLDLKFENLEFKPDWETVRAEYVRLGFKSIVSKLPGIVNSSQLTVDSNDKKSVNRKPSTDNNTDQLKLI